MADYTAAERQAVRDRAKSIAARGISSIRTADREHRISDPNKLEEFARKMDADLIDDDYGGFIGVKFENPSA